MVTASHYRELCPQALALLEEQGHEVVLNGSDMPYYSFGQLSGLVADIDAAIVGMDRWDEAVFKLAPRLKVIARFGVGIDNIDLLKAREYGIAVTNARGRNANAVAELALCYILAVLRSLLPLSTALRAGTWLRAVGREIAGKTVGLLGFGDIARRVAKKLQGFDARIIAYDTFPDEDAARALGVRFVSMEELLKLSDVVSVHAPSTKETFHLMNADAFGRMKRNAFLINTARGTLVDTEALCDAVEAGVIAGAAVDVYEQEPLPPDARILGIGNILCTPHTGAETYETYTSVSLCTARAVLDVLSGKQPENLLN